jgi:DNA-binding response OmpR family regulator
MPDEAKQLKLVHSAPMPATVLVIDDDPDMVESLAMMLGDHGFPVLTANDGVRGLEMFREYKPAVVLSDILMPEQDGIEVIMTMRRERPGVKIIAISGSGRIGTTDFLTMARKLGADAAFEKGHKAGELLGLLKTMLQR